MRSKYILLACVALAFVLAGCEDEQKYAKKTGLDSIELLPEDVTLTEGFTRQLTATTSPASNEAILEWLSEDPTIATVSGNGLVTAVRGGSTAIIAFAGGTADTVTVTVNAVANIVLTPTEAHMEIGDQLQLGAATVPAVVEGIVLSYASSDEDVATVSSSGLITATGPGEATITVKGGRMTKDMTVTVNDPDEVDQELWQKLDASSEWNAGSSVANAIDGNSSSFWHSDASEAMPQWFSVDMGALKNIDGFLFTNRQEKDQLAHPKKVIFAVSNNGTTWETALEIDVPDLFRQQILPLAQRKTARYFKVTVESNWAGANYTYIADVSIYSGAAPAPNPSIMRDATVVKWSSTLGAGMEGTKLIDNNISSPWHSSVGDPLPWAVIDMTESVTVEAIYFTGRQGAAGDTNASPKNIVFSVCDDYSVDDNAGTWEELINVEELPNLRTKQTLNAPTPKAGRYLKIDIKSNWAGAPYSYIGEIDIVAK